jgi:hypothetical protein
LSVGIVAGCADRGEATAQLVTGSVMSGMPSTRAASL